ncbi:P-loop containing nucleoside triphosphate hydrolase protein [Russula brevipes]|nr:P-loop containing nucleoside triphosphate hydrolase protein [Russula brevipes]
MPLRPTRNLAQPFNQRLQLQQQSPRNMQSNSSKFKKAFRSVFPASSTAVTPTLSTRLDPASSEQIGGVPDIGVSAVETSLAAMKEASALVAKIPWFSPVAGLILQALTMREEVKQYKEEWDVVMGRLESIARLVNNVGVACKRYNLEEEDLPDGLREIFQSLKTELGGIKGALDQNKNTGGIKKMLLRKDLLRKVKQYDAKLSNVLQIFHATLTMDVRFAQLAEGPVVTRGAPTQPASSSNIVISMPQEPPVPQIFFGRDSELAEIVHMIFANIGSRPARIAILGPGGYGKTTLANAVLTHHRVREHFGNARYFVSCESVFSSDGLLIELAKILDLLDGTTDVSWSHICTVLNTKDCILCLDNFESLWDQDGDTRNSVEELLSRVTGLWCLTVLITMRGTVRPGQTQWTIPLLPPLMTLDHDSAKSVWVQTAQNYDEFAEELIKSVDYVPLAVTLLAHLAQATSPEILLKQWHKKNTQFIHTSQANKLSNLEHSIQISMDSGRMRAVPSAKEMLGVLSMLPDGMHIEQVDSFQTILDIDILSGLHTLQECSLISVIGERYQPHPIIRNFCNNYISISQKHKDVLRDFYITLAFTMAYDAEASRYAEMVLEIMQGLLMPFAHSQSFKALLETIQTN